jgi:polyhydroxybutyrate depolymerase
MNFRKHIFPSAFFVSLLLAEPPQNLGHGMDYTDSMIIGGSKRTWLIHFPETMDKTKPLPLLIALHGGGGTGHDMIRLTLGGFNTLADKNGFLVVYPDGIDKHWNDGRISDKPGHQADKRNNDDVGFISSLIDHLVKDLNADPKRVYVTGMSNGAIMSYRLACELSRKIAAIAPVAGNIPENLLHSCSPSMPVSVLAINSVNDPLVPFGGGYVTGPYGLRKLGKVLSASESVKFWADHDSCSKIPVTDYEPDGDPHDGTRIKREVYGNGENKTEVVLYSIEGGGHTWPGGYQYFNERIIGKTCRDMNANEVIWSFFDRH